jgi:hypothetical protein
MFVRAKCRNANFRKFCTRGSSVNRFKRLKICKNWSTHNSIHKKLYLLGYNAVWSVTSQSMFRRNVRPTSSGSKHKPSLVTCFMLLPFLAYSLTLEMEEICSSETSVDFQRSIMLYNAADRRLHLKASKQTFFPQGRNTRLSPEREEYTQMCKFTSSGMWRRLVW